MSFLPSMDDHKLEGQISLAADDKSGYVITASDPFIGKDFNKHHASRGACSSQNICQVIYSRFGLAIHQNDHQARRRFVEWAQNEIAVVPDFHKRILFSDEAHFWLNDYVNKQNCRIWSEANPQVYAETPSLVRTSSKTMKATTLQSIVIGTEP
ncbi:hypothetical protein TNCV_1888661 [Trichonephila clavipes]|nr:hypothetical protein TNCV_1888661 [Trichonephila clavipes]